MGTKRAALEMFKATGTVDPSIGVVVNGFVRWRPQGMSDVRWRIERRRLSNLVYYNGLSDVQTYSRSKFGG